MLLICTMYFWFFLMQCKVCFWLDFYVYYACLMKHVKILQRILLSSFRKLALIIILSWNANWHILFMLFLNVLCLGFPAYKSIAHLRFDCYYQCLTSEFYGQCIYMHHLESRFLLMWQWVGCEYLNFHLEQK